MNPFATQSPLRGLDQWGSGDFGAPRGPRTHRGVDFLAQPGDSILTLRPGKVTKIGYPYSEGVGSIESRNPLRYVQLTSYLKVLPADGTGPGSIQPVQTRVFYIQPEVHLHQLVPVGTPIGIQQDLSKRFPADESGRGPIISHYHVESRYWDSVRSEYIYIHPVTLRVP